MFLQKNIRYEVQSLIQSNIKISFHMHQHIKDIINSLCNGRKKFELLSYMVKTN
jgi:cytochrome c-type biogenesis protein CcmH/NrfF